MEGEVGRIIVFRFVFRVPVGGGGGPTGKAVLHKNGQCEGRGRKIVGRAKSTFGRGVGRVKKKRCQKKPAKANPASLIV